MLKWAGGASDREMGRTLGAPVSYIVIQKESSGEAAYREFDDLGSAVAYLEEVCNDPGGRQARLCSLEPVAYEVKQYFKVELPTEVAASADAVMEAAADDAEPDDVSVVDNTTVFEPVSFVEASDLEPLGSSRDSHLTGESRRGLFGR